MKILFVVNNYYAPGNGLSASARRTVEGLREAGQEVRILSGRNHAADTPQPDYLLPDYHIPIFDKLVRSHGYKFAKRDKETIREAVQWADVVHLEEPFAIQWETARIAGRLGVPCTGTYHLHPENLFCSIHFGGLKLLNNTTLRLWRHFVFNHCSHLQCPTENVRNRLSRFHFRSNLHVIPNGIRLEPSIRQETDTEPSSFLVTCIGRIAVEKDPYTLLEAMRYSRYADRIQLYFAGRGPELEKLQRRCQAFFEKGIVRHMPVIQFHNRDELRQLAARADLLVHCAKVEVEGLSVQEALQQGVVPVIAEGPLTATSQFALYDRSVFPVRKARALAGQIDYWLEHPQERRAAGKEYARSMQEYDIRRSIEALIRMFEEARAK